MVYCNPHISEIPYIQILKKQGVFHCSSFLNEKESPSEMETSILLGIISNGMSWGMVSGG